MKLVAETEIEMKSAIFIGPFPVAPASYADSAT